MYSHQGEDNLSITELLSSPSYEPVSEMKGSVPHLEMESNAFLLPQNNDILNLERSLSTARISSTGTDGHKSGGRTFKNCPEVKFINFLLSTMGVPCCGASKFTHYLQVVLFHALWLLNSVKAATCFMATDDRQDLYGGLVFTSALVILLWWNMYRNRSKLVKLYHSLASKRSRKIVGVVFACSLVLFPPIVRAVIKIAFGNYYNRTQRPRSCRNYWIPTDFGYIGHAVFLLDLATGYAIYSVFFITAFVYCYFCFLIIRRFGHRSWEASSCCNRRSRELLMSIVREFERAMSFPVLVVLSQIVLDVFTVVSLMASSTPSSRYSASMVGFAVSTPQTVVWFVLIVGFADRVQGRCLRSIEAIFAGAREPPNYYVYKEMKRSCTLTAWSMFVINRKLLLTSAASLITYSVVISELKEG